MLNIKEVITKPIFIILASLTIILFIISIILQIVAANKTIKPQTLPRPSLKTDIIQPISLQYRYSGQLPQLTTKLSVFSVPQNTDQFQKPFLTELGKNFNFTQSPALDQGIEFSTAIFTKPNADLVISYPPLIIEYGNYQSTQRPKNLIDSEQFINLAKSFLAAKNILTNTVTLDNGYVQLLQTDQQGIGLPVSDPNLADYVSVNFNYLLDGKPLIDIRRRDYPVKLVFNLDSSIRKATIIYPPTLIDIVGTADITTPDQALQAINNGQGNFSKLNNPTVAYTELNQNDMSTATFNSVELVYVYDYDSSSIQPFYRFQGYGYTQDGEKIEVGVIITALPQDLYQK